MIKEKTNTGMNVFFGILFFLYLLLSSSAMPLFDETGPGIKPDILLSLCCVCPLFAGKKASCVYAVIFGFVSDIIVTPPFHFSPVLFFLCAAAIPVMARSFSKPTVAVCAVFSLPFLLLRAITGSFYLLSQFPEITTGEMLSRCIVPETLFNFACVIITYFISFAVIKLFRLDR